MEPQNSDLTGDYGYDEAHVDVRRRPSSPDATSAEPGRGPARHRPDNGGDDGGDYGYDEAHSF